MAKNIESDIRVWFKWYQRERERENGLRRRHEFKYVLMSRIRNLICSIVKSNRIYKLSGIFPFYVSYICIVRIVIYGMRFVRIHIYIEREIVTVHAKRTK